MTKRRSRGRGTPAGATNRTRPEPAAAGPQAALRWLERRAAWATLGLLCLLASLAYAPFLFGDDLFLFVDMGHDSVNLFYPRWFHMAEYLRSEGLPGWSFQQGLGQDIRPYALGDPFNWILYGVGSEQLAFALAWVEVGKIVAAGMGVFAALRVIGCLPVTAMVGAVGFAFSGYMVVAGTWHVFSTRGVAFVLLWLAFERILMRGSWWLFPLAVALTAALQPPILLPFALGLALFAALRFTEERGFEPRAFGRLAARLTGWGLLGLAISAWFSVPILRNLIQSPRTAAEWSAASRILQESPLVLEYVPHYWSALARWFSSDLLRTADDFTGWYNYLESPLFYCGLASLFFFTQGFALIPARRRRLYAIAAGVAAVPVLLPWARFVFWGFSGNYYREFSLVVVLALFYPAMRGLDALLRGGVPGPRAVALGLGLLCSGLFAPAVLAAEPVAVDGPLAAAAAALLVGFAGLALLARLPQARPWVPLLLLLLASVEAVGFTRVSLSRRDVMHKSAWSERAAYQDASAEAIAEIRKRDPGFYRIEKDFGSSPATAISRNDSKVQGYFGTMSYYSFNQLHASRFLAEFEFIDRGREEHTRWSPGFNNVVPSQGFGSVKYLLLARPPTEAGSRGLAKLAEYPGFSVYRNRYFVPLGFPLSSWIPLSEVAGLPYELRRSGLLHVAYFDERPPELIHANFERVDPAVFEQVMSGYTLENAAAAVRRLNATALAIEEFSHNRIRGRIELESPQILVFTIPWDRGWTATVNGEAARLFRVDVGFTGLVLDRGAHEVVLDYVAPLGRAAAVVSLAALLLLGMLLAGWRPPRSGPAS